jgi:RNA polymerase sigma factor (sigma-70 family)
VPAEEAGVDSEDAEAFSGVVIRDDGDDPEARTLRHEMAELIQRCLEALPSPQDRLVIVSRVIEGLKLKDLAETLGRSIENIRQWQKRVEKLMRACMERHGWSMEG